MNTARKSVYIDYLIKDFLWNSNKMLSYLSPKQ